MRTFRRYSLLFSLVLPAMALFLFFQRSSAQSPVFTDYRSQSPGRKHHITLKDLPPPYATPSADSASACGRASGERMAQGAGGIFSAALCHRLA